MNIDIINKIENIEDFKLLIEEVIQKSKIDLHKKTFASGVLNFDKEQSIYYFKNERQKLLNKLKKNSFSIRVKFENQNIILNKEDCEQLYVVPAIVYSSLEQFKWNEQAFTKKKKELIIYYKKRLKDIKNSILIAFYNNKIEELKGGLKTDYNSVIFDKKESQEFFVYIVEKWLKNEVNKVTAIRFVFTEMWFKNANNSTPYKITATQPYFASEYWNLKYSNIYEFKNPKNPKLNKDSFTEYYPNRFKKHLTEFQGV
jgi:hypothetical protein